MNERLDPTDPRVWLARARSDLKLAEVGYQQEVFLEDLCFEAQQAAEKALKATRYQNLARVRMTACS